MPAKSFLRLLYPYGDPPSSPPRSFLGPSEPLQVPLNSSWHPQGAPPPPPQILPSTPRPLSVNPLLPTAVATRIEVPPQTVTAKKGETVTFRCVAAFDPGLAHHGLEWRRDGRLLRETADSDK